jgi:hypothetical protein
MVIPRDKYLFNPSANTIQLLDQYSLYTAERIRSIYNLSKQVGIYNYRNPCKNNALKNISGMDISVSNGLITYNDTTRMSSDDILHIEIDTIIVASTSGGFQIDSINALSSKSIAASGSLTTTGVPTINCSKVNIYISNTGAATGVEVTVNGSPTSDLTLSKTIGDVIKLNANSSTGPIIGECDIPGYIWFSIVNKDSSNAAIITISIDRVINSYTQTNTTVFSNASVVSGTPVTSPDVYTSASKRVNIYCSQAGASTNTTFDVYGKSSQVPSISKLLATCTIGSNQQWGCGLLSEVIPGSVYVVITNTDTVNSASATALVESFVCGD